jgi:acetyl esterase/lipase
MSIGIVRALSLLNSQRPTRPARAVAEPARVQRHRHGLSRVPATWIDVDRATTGTIVHVHGGAFVQGEQPMHWEWLEEVARRSETAGAMIHYRMAPRFPFPTAVEDVVHALESMSQESRLRPGRWVLSGDGAGAGIALAAALVLAENPLDTPAQLLLTAPWADLTRPVAGDEELDHLASLYRGVADPRDPRLSPLLGDLGKLPPVQLITGTDSPVPTDADRLRDALTAAGGAPELLVEEGEAAAYPLTGTGPRTQRARRAQIAAVRRVLGLDLSDRTVGTAIVGE